MSDAHLGSAPTGPLTSAQRELRIQIQRDFVHCLGIWSAELIYDQLIIELRLEGCRAPSRIKDLLRQEGAPETLSVYLLSIDDKTVEVIQRHLRSIIDAASSDESRSAA